MTFACSTLVHNGRHTTSVGCGIWGYHISVVVCHWASGCRRSENVGNHSQRRSNTAQDLYASLLTYVSAIFWYLSPFCSQCCEGCGLRRHVCKYNATAICKLTGSRSDVAEVSVPPGYAPRHWMIDARQSRQRGLIFKDRMTAEDETTTLSRNVWNHPPTDEAPYPGRTKTSTALVQLRLNIHCGIKCSTTVEINTPTMQVLLKSDCVIHSVDVDSNQQSAKEWGHTLTHNLLGSSEPLLCDWALWSCG